ncbi:MAG: hypothetical protein Q9184_008171, partial [Pyrenodesmia sp. 2 TL-2023]
MRRRRGRVGSSGTVPARIQKQRRRFIDGKEDGDQLYIPHMRRGVCVDSSSTIPIPTRIHQRRRRQHPPPPIHSTIIPHSHLQLPLVPHQHTSPAPRPLQHTLPHHHLRHPRQILQPYLHRAQRVGNVDPHDAVIRHRSPFPRHAVAAPGHVLLDYVLAPEEHGTPGVEAGEEEDGFAAFGGAGADAVGA